MENNYYNIVNFIEAIDAVIYDNNGDIDVDWYEIVNIFLI